MEQSFFDAHSHAHFPAYGDESNAVVQRALDAGVQMILVGTEQGTSEGAIALAEQFDGVWAAVGLHPTHTTPAEYIDEKELGDFAKAGYAHAVEKCDPATYQRLAEHSKVVAIGECGLDYYRLDPETARIQQEALLTQMAVAKAVQKPITIHCRNAFADLLDLFKAHRELLLDTPGTIHFFTGTLEEAKTLLDMGFYLQFGGVITFAKMYEEIVQALPLERMITETDAPYVAPVPYRGKRNEPAYVVEVVKKIAEIKGLSVEAVRKQVRENVQTVFKI